MIWGSFIKRTLMMISLILIFLACIPKEEIPPDRLVLRQERLLPEILNENSGMTGFNKLIWFINDSGNDSAMYGWNRATNAIDQKIVIKNTTNNDWEDITANSHFLFIGDFGNNAYGNRQDLRIYMVDKNDITADADTIDCAGIISFVYDDQTDFSPTDLPNSTSFDCEAFIATDDSIILFTKDWLTGTSRLYTIPSQAGNFVAKHRTTWDVNGLATAAAWSPETNNLYILGYTNFGSPFLCTYQDFDECRLTYSRSTHILFNVFITQTEGLMIDEDGSLLCSSEQFTSVTPPVPATFFVISR